jgi:ParB family chromosome partitioning protein
MDEFKLTQEELGTVLGKNRVVIANTLRLLHLPQDLQDAVADGTISAGHARNLVSISDGNLQKEVAQRILDERLTVREVEKIVSDWKGAIAGGKVAPAARKAPEIRQLEESLQQSLGTKVEVRVRGQGEKQKGQIRISFFSLDDLQRVLDVLQKKP